MRGQRTVSGGIGLMPTSRCAPPTNACGTWATSPPIERANGGGAASSKLTGKPRDLIVEATSEPMRPPPVTTPFRLRSRAARMAFASSTVRSVRAPPSPPAPEPTWPNAGSDDQGVEIQSLRVVAGL